METEFRDRVSRKEIGDGNTGRAFDINRVHLTAQQCGRFRPVGLPVSEAVELRALPAIKNTFGKRDIDDLDIGGREPFERQSGNQALQRRCCHEVDDTGWSARNAEAPADKIARRFDPGLGQRDDGLEFVGPGDADEPRRVAFRAGADRRDVAAMAKRIIEMVIEVAGSDGAVLAVDDRVERNALRGKRLVEQASWVASPTGVGTGQRVYQICEMAFFVTRFSAVFDGVCREAFFVGVALPSRPLLLAVLISDWISQTGAVHDIL